MENQEEVKQEEVEETKQTVEKKKKFNVPLFIVLTLLCVVPGIIYLISYLLTPKDGVYKGNVGKVLCAIIALVTVAILSGELAEEVGDKFTLAAVVLLIITVVSFIFKKKIFSIIYLVCVIGVLGFVAFFLYIYPSILLIVCFMPMIIGCIIGIAAGIRGIQYVGNKSKE